jgi:uncharacterized lipoprotein YehR (DUF1307 family)
MRLVSALVLSFLLLTGCDRLAQLAKQAEVVQKQGEELKVIDGKIDNLEKHLNDLQLNYDGIKSHCNELEQKLFELQSKHYEDMGTLLYKHSLLESMINRNKSITIDATSKGFQRLDTDLGPFLISVDGVTPYLNGHKLNLRIGNPSMCNFAGFTLKAKWGGAFNQNGEVTYADWEKSLKSKEENFTERLEPGAWNKIEIVLAPAKPEQLEYIEIQMEVNHVLLTSGGHLGMEPHIPALLEWMVLDFNAKYRITFYEHLDFAISFAEKYPDTIVIFCDYSENVNRTLMNKGIAHARELVERRKDKFGYKWLKIEENIQLLK